MVGFSVCGVLIQACIPNQVHFIILGGVKADVVILRRGGAYCTRRSQAPRAFFHLSQYNMLTAE